MQQGNYPLQNAGAGLAGAPITVKEMGLMTGAGSPDISCLAYNTYFQNIAGRVHDLAI
jgi:hypothetical protein